MMLGITAEAALRSFALVAVLWGALAIFHVRDARVQSTAWRTMLMASLFMPLLIQFVVLRIATATAGAPLPMAPMAGAVTVATTVAPIVTRITKATLTWGAIAWWIYLVVATVLLVRLLLGLALTWRMVRNAECVREGWTNGLDARRCAATSVPVTFGSTVLLPIGYVDWPSPKRRAVVVHERAHVENGDFYIQILSSLNRALFWFNPAAWWLHAKLTTLAETISDDAALEEVADRPNYAEVLLDMSSSLHKTPAGVAMARPATVKARVERILASTALTSRLNWGRRALLTAVMVPLIALAALSIAPVATAQTQATPKVVAVNPALRDSYIGYYKFDADTPAHDAVLTVTSEGDHLAAQLTGQGKVEIFPSSANEFFYTVVKASITFIADSQGHVNGLVLHQAGMDMHATRTTPAAASQELAVVDKKMAEQQKPHSIVAIDPKLLDGYVGRYQLAPKAIFTITREGNQLFAELTGQPKFPVYPYGPKDFFYTVVAAQLTFVTDAKARATQVILHQNGRDASAPRIE